MKEYNGHRSWNAWNVSLWIGNDEPLYRFAMECIAKAQRAVKKHLWLPQGPQGVAGRAARYFMESCKGDKTPDGAKYNHLAVKLCLQGFIDD